MLKAFSFLIVAFLICTTVAAQKTATDSTSAVAQYGAELRSQLATQSIPAASADSIAAIELTFAAELRSIAAQTTLLLRDREIKLNLAHRARRTGLMAIVHSGRAMEDVVYASDVLMRKYHL